jgi:hypothetical protein
MMTVSCRGALVLVACEVFPVLTLIREILDYPYAASSHLPKSTVVRTLTTSTGSTCTRTSTAVNIHFKSILVNLKQNEK